MSEDRRRHRRVQLPAVRATFETAGGESAEGVVHDIGVGGAFVQSRTPLAVGKRIVLEIAIEGETTPVTAAARVVWAREADDVRKRPAGMALVFLDLDDAARALIARLTATRERTVIGVAAPANEPNTGAADAAPKDARARTALGLGAPVEREKSLPIDLVTRPQPPAAPAPSDQPPLLSARSPVLWLLVLIVVIIVLAFFFRAQLFGTDATAPAPARTETETGPSGAAPSSVPSASAGQPPHKLVPRVPPR